MEADLTRPRQCRRARHCRGGGEGVVLTEVEDHDDVPVTVDDADEEGQVDYQRRLTYEVWI